MIDINILLMTGEIPTLLCTKYMIENRLDLFLKYLEITHGGKTHKLQLENVFLGYRWGIQYMKYVLFTDQKLMRIHKVFGHPSVGATQMILGR